MDESCPELGLTSEAESTQQTIRDMLATFLDLGRIALRK